MRSFTDHDGKHWDVTVGKESYGNLVLLFAERRGNAIRKRLMDAHTHLDAARELEEMTDRELADRLQDAVPWDSPSV